MTKKLRLVVTDECDKGCPGCCMKAPSRKPKPIDYQGILRHPAQEIYITGGEPLKCGLETLLGLIMGARSMRKHVILYSACLTLDQLPTWESYLPYLSGATLTVHHKSEVEETIHFLDALDPHFKKRSGWLNDFTGSFGGPKYKNFTVRQKQWAFDCPVPAGEDYREFLLPVRYEEWEKS